MKIYILSLRLSVETKKEQQTFRAVFITTYDITFHNFDTTFTVITVELIYTYENNVKVVYTLIKAVKDIDWKTWNCAWCLPRGKESGYSISIHLRMGENSLKCLENLNPCSFK